ncbi:MAG: glycosyltransferase family 4 protein [Elusimicrobiales bacterium]|nr:glycosyltransferase family 4 protein [Elusimicrobiales bacterium]HOJ86879.1 glycosyltransferase family 4 protein [Elusimicrobiales bacterium]HOL62899.1 glycosyltransferase family 4 protein [Elusimicrobiales bacterium]HPO95957.1 glycosyltransferase family 4 protein [Elusimicrobiales bacterium]
MKIKIVHIITKLELGGAQGNTIYTVSNLDKGKFDVTLICGRGGVLDEKTGEIDIVFIDDLVREISPLKDIKAFWKIYKIIKEKKPDIVHTHSSKAGIIGRFASFFAGVKKIIHTYHGFGFNDYQNMFVKHFYILIEKISCLITERIIFVSKDNIKTALRYGIGKSTKYELIRSGIKLSDYSNRKNYEFVKKLGIEKNNSVIISTVANLKPQKNPEDFYEVAKNIINSGYDAYFIYAGGGERLEYFQNKAELDKISRRVFFVGWVLKPFDVYSCSDIFILTSLWEGLPRSLVEAMSSGVVPVCYKTDGVNDIIIDGANGFIVEQKNVKRMTDTVKKLIEEPKLLEKIKENVLKTDLSEFDIDFMVKKQEELYLNL